MVQDCGAIFADQLCSGYKLLHFLPNRIYIHGVFNIVGNFGTTFVDQCYSVYLLLHLQPNQTHTHTHCFYSEESGLLPAEKHSGYSGFKPPLFPTMDPRLGIKQSVQSLPGTAYHLAVKERRSARLHLPHCKDPLHRGAEGWLASPL